MAIQSMLDQYYVIGYPVKHTLSPKIHNEFASQTKQNMCYGALEVYPDNLEQALNMLKLDETVKGLSITLPFKERLYEYCDHLERLAEQAQAVSNVIINNKREFIGLNLDGLGLVNDIKNNLYFPIYAKTILIIGAGGAVKGILGALLQEGPSKVVIANRTLAKAQILVERIQLHNTQLEVQALDDIIGSYDLVINATSASIDNQQLPLDLTNFNKGALGYDLMYAQNGTVFTHWCKQNGINAVDGKGMLTELSKIAFYCWRGVRI
ncbi:shikimate dehydrogenase [Fastidiosibacter lacustris]|uniref:shikimate dehydrogenase n=1 Tax=Fastidiosibacter lacustris TaxID=2056695 RepID=UPI000E356FDF|nr:shikimate dehydrogenase [Fastidiosibacter lacustris]